MSRVDGDLITQNVDSSKIDKTSTSTKKLKELSENETLLFDAVAAENVDDIKQLLAKGIPADSTDSHGMTPLQHVAYRGNRVLCELFINHGADVNTNAHDQGYTPLMFAALSGNKEVVRLLLERGARTSTENSVHRTAAQMAGFVGRHEVASLINNYFARDDLDYYSTPRGLETEPKLPPVLAPLLYKFILIVNLNPVKLSYYLQQCQSLLENSDKVARVLDLLCEKSMKQRDTNEILAIKFHYLACIVRQAAKNLNDKHDNLDSWIRYLLKSTDDDDTPIHQEQLIRSMLSDFPYVQSQLLQQIVRTITNEQVGGISATNVLTSCINGQRFAADKACSTCGDVDGKTCATCKSVYYCNRDCQKYHWFVHKKFCAKLAESYKRRLIDEERREKERKKAAEDESKHKELEQSTDTPSLNENKTEGYSSLPNGDNISSQETKLENQLEIEKTDDAVSKKSGDGSGDILDSPPT